MQFFAALSLLTAGAAAAARPNYALKESHPVPRSWMNEGSADKDHPIQLKFGLKQADETAIERHLLETSDPKHARYGQHLTVDEVHQLTGPTAETLDRVRAWLMEHGITAMSHNPAKDWISVSVTIEKAEDLLQTTYSKFRHEDGDMLVRAPEWSLPLDLHEHIDVVQPTNSFFRPNKQSFPPLVDEGTMSIETWQAMQKKQAPHILAAQAANSANVQQPDVSKVCNNTFVTPTCLRTLYRTLNYTSKAASKNSVGLCNYLNETAYRNDAFLFLEAFRDQTVAQTAYSFKTTIINNGPDDQGPYTPAQIAAGHNEEANLDSQLVLGISYPAPLTTFNTGGMPPFTPDDAVTTNTNEPYLDFLDYILGERDIPLVISSSYGDDEQTVPKSYAQRVCQGFAQLGARGVTVLFSSGDSGVGPDGKCFTNDKAHKPSFLPAFPAGCPYVTSVGSTANFNPEVATQRFASGAGFSNYFAMPSYQTTTVKNYLAGVRGISSSLYNSSGRAYPDVAAQGNHDVIVWNGRIITIGGTSASSPTVAAVLTLVNDALLAAGKPSLGFINPWLYSTGYKAFTDVVSGSSYGCNTSGFPAVVGWDAVTGFGTPDLPSIISAALKKQN